MKIVKYVLPVIAAGFVASSASAAISASNSIDNSLAGITQNNWTVDTTGDLTSAVLYVELTAGSSFDPFAASLTLDGGGFVSRVTPFSPPTVTQQPVSRVVLATWSLPLLQPPRSPRPSAFPLASKVWGRPLDAMAADDDQKFFRILQIYWQKNSDFQGCRA